MKEAYLYEKLENKKVRCRLCNQHCLIKDGEKGLCGVRENTAGTLTTMVYDKVIATHSDPIEKKPLFHFLPGSCSFSIATVGCNFKCLFCQNADISQMPVDHHRIAGQSMTPAQIVQAARDDHCASISYTYTEPTIYFELASDTAEAAASEGIKNVFVTNGFMTRECLEAIYPHLHAANVDLKAFTDGFYKKQCGGRLKPVLKSIETMKQMGIWIELTTLLIPGLNDAPDELRSLAGFIADLDPGIPWHVSRFHPDYRLINTSSTPVESIRTALEIGKETGLQYVYAGNVPGNEGEKTFCHACGALLIDRFGYNVMSNTIHDGTCPSCQASIPGVWRQ